jgi:deoxyribodipyrimidine photo-lyase
MLKLSYWVTRPTIQQDRSDSTVLERTRPLNQKPIKAGPVIYWMNRDMRADDNWALLYAQAEALRLGQPLLAVFCLQQQFLGAQPHHFAWMLAGLAEVAETLDNLNIPFLFCAGDPAKCISALASRLAVGLIVNDFSPLRLPRTWREELASRAAAAGIASIEVDAHNVIPCWLASDKLEYAARTIRPKIHRQLSSFLTEIPQLQVHPIAPDEQQLAVIRDFGHLGLAARDFASAKAHEFGAFSAKSSILPTAGSSAARRRLADFLDHGLPFYGERNDPNRPVTSRLSPYLHFGQISAQRVALEVQARANEAVEQALGTPAADFLEELIVRRELADNFCFYNPHYDSYDGFPAWARQTLDRHRADPRAYRYNSEQLETGQTADNLWNAAQQELVRQGTMPGYLRMYWAKKLLEWCASPELAMQIAISFNDGYALDGRDPNGYTGIAWSIGGVHDRPWGERSVFGTIRFMSYDGCKRKFSIEDYVRKVREG